MTVSPQTLTITRPDDWHLHVRDGEALLTVVPHTAAQFGRAIIMPNLRPPVTTAAQALAYRQRILAAVPDGLAFEPLMTLYLTDNLPPDEIARAREAGVVAAKLYPAGATTNSDAGVTELRKTYATLEAMQKAGMPLLVHGEVTSPDIDLFDREAVFIEQQLMPLRRDFPELKIVFEHITTREAAQYVREAGPFTAATITAHHLLYNRNAIFTGGIRPHYYCLPVLKREEHRRALVAAATSGSGVRMLTRISLPVFVSGGDAGKPAPILRAARWQGDALAFSLGNEGTAFLPPQALSLQLLAADGSVLQRQQLQGNYVLAGASLPLRVHAAAALCARATQLALRLEETGTDLRLPLQPRHCAP